MNLSRQQKFNLGIIGTTSTLIALSFLTPHSAPLVVLNVLLSLLFVFAIIGVVTTDGTLESDKEITYYCAYAAEITACSFLVFSGYITAPILFIVAVALIFASKATS